MIVYVVMAGLDNDRKEFHGVFSTQEKAENRVNKLNKAYGGNICYWEETELDNP